ncbi:hypothetical protein Rhopal_000017-T1 [Rhodotorula paludigena]|uniref:Dopey N-terminal domain-containing protein n=1 Tax=Rhodotorula paludigena TaxID=86838 RepID=A0AAV5GCK4_9BASI|nr:hypothetical protein Rhopal_000017-T1 [Rhodotorula paludigena]
MLPHSATPVQAVAPSLSSATATADTAPPRRSSTGRVRDSFAAIAQQEKALQSDPKYRKYATAVDKTLQAFDQVNEWADFITFLAKLLKCLQAAPQFPVIPHKLIVAKRLSQCLNPALPTGPDNLRRDLPAWSSGLFPFFQYAATSVKPIVLNMYERFYLPLQEDLRPATKAFILALLPGLEEETGEWFEKVAALLDRLSGTVSPSFFFQNLWLVLITAPTSRIPAINYLSRRLPKVSPVKTAPNDAQPTPTVQDDDGLSDIVGQDVGLMVRGFAAALEDDKVLVQRGILDLLNGTLRLDSPGFRNCRRADQVLLMRAVLGVVLRRDLSLSRRLYTWLLGSSDASSSQVEHLRAYGLSLLHESLQAEMSAVAGLASDQTTERQRPFKIFISLLDKWEIGANLTEVGVLDAFQALKEDLRPEDAHDDLLMTGNMLFEVLDPFLLWKQLYLTSRNEVEGIQDGEKERSSSLELARSSDMKSASLPEVDGRALLAAGLSAAFEIVQACVAEPHANAPATFTLTAVKLLTRLHEVVLDLDTSGVDVVWQPTDWINSIAAFIASTRANPATFRIDAALVKLILDLAAAQGLRPPAKVDRRSVVEVMAKKLLDYLVAGNAPCYLEAADLLWQVGGLSPRRDLETMISAHLGSPDPVERARAFESFGNLWRFVGKSLSNHASFHSSRAAKR